MIGDFCGTTSRWRDWGVHQELQGDAAFLSMALTIWWSQQGHFTCWIPFPIFAGEISILKIWWKSHEIAICSWWNPVVNPRSSWLRVVVCASPCSRPTPTSAAATARWRRIGGGSSMNDNRLATNGRERRTNGDFVGISWDLNRTKSWYKDSWNIDMIIIWFLYHLAFWKWGYRVIVHGI